MDNNPTSNDYSKYRPTIDVKSIFKYLAVHPGLVIFLVYTIIAISGFIYLITFYRFFGLEVIVYLEITDVLVAGIKDPIVMLMVLTSFGLVFFIWLATYILAPWNAWIDRKCRNGKYRLLRFIFGFKGIKTFWWSALAILLLYFVTFIHLHSKKKSKRIKEQQAYLIQVESDGISEPSHAYSLLGTSINYIFLYDHDTKENLILPLENVQSLKPILSENTDKKAVQQKKPEI